MKLFNQDFYTYLHRQIPVMMFLSLFPGLGYVFLGWMHDIATRAIFWYLGIVIVSIWGYRLYHQYLHHEFSQKQLFAWYSELRYFYYSFFLLWLVIFLLFIAEDRYNLHYIAIFTELGASVVASVLLVPDKRLFKPSILGLMIPLVIYFALLNEWFGYVLSVFSIVFTWVLIYAAQSSHSLLMRTNYQANHDFLTGLKNRYFFINYLQTRLNSIRQFRHFSYLLLIDLDHFKTINDSLGHDVGDLLLQQVADRIVNVLPKDTLVARLGGDEFVVVGPEVERYTDCSQDAEKVANQVLVTLKDSYKVERHNLYISASIGVSLVLQATHDANRFIKEADIAMYEAKERGRDGVIIFDDNMAERVARNLELERLLHFSLEKEEISLVYQPQVDVDNKVIGAEVLVRWSNDKLGQVSPVTFIPIAEHTGFIIELGRYIMESAFQTLNHWERKGVAIKQFSINVSMRQFFYYDFVDDVRLLCEEYLSETTRKKVVFEVTESLIAEDIDKVIAIMNEIKGLGIRFSMDDFGTGYSSLSYLKQLPIDEIKIDRSFVSELNMASSDPVMISTILNMAHQFELSVVAEGVETAEQLEFLRQNQCHCYQGFYFSKPLIESEFRSYYLEH